MSVFFAEKVWEDWVKDTAYKTVVTTEGILRVNSFVVVRNMCLNLFKKMYKKWIYCGW